MLAGRHLGGPQHIVDPAQLQRLPIESGCPAGVVYLREDNHSARLALHIIVKLVGIILGKHHAPQTVGQHGAAALAKHRLETLVSHGLGTQVDGREGIYLLVGGIYIFNIAYKPSVAHGKRILHGKLLSLAGTDNEILVIKHIEHGEETVALDGGEVALAVIKRLDNFAHFIANMTVDEILVAAQLHCAVATYALVEIGGLVFVEGVGGEIEHTVIQALVLQYLLISSRLLEHAVDVLRQHKHLIVEIALVDTVHIHKAQHRHNSHGNNRLQQLLCHQPYQRSTQQHIDKCAPCVGSEYGLAGAYDIVKDVRILRQLAVFAGRVIGLVETGEHGIEQRCTAHQGKAHP